MELTATTLVVAEPTSASPATAAAVDPTMPPVIALPPVVALPALPEIVLSPWALLGAVSGLLLAVGVLLVDGRRRWCPGGGGRRPRGWARRNAVPGTARGPVAGARPCRRGCRG